MAPVRRRPATLRAVHPGLLLVALVVASAAAPRVAIASGTPVLNLEWSAPAACPRGDEVREMASALLGSPVVARGSASTQVRARVRASAGGFVLTIETRSSSGTDRRRLQDPRCAVLAEAAALIAAAAADSSLAPTGVTERTGAAEAGDAQGGAPADATVPLPPGEPGAVTVPPAPELSPGTGDLTPGPGARKDPGTGDLTPGPGARKDPGTGGPAVAPAVLAPEAVLSPGTGAAEAGAPAEVRALARPRLGLRLGGIFDVGSVPGPTGGIALTAAVFGRLWRAEVEGLWLAPRTAQPMPDLGARVGMFAGAVRGCVVPAVRRLEVPICGHFEAGVERGRGVGGALANPGQTDDVPWLALGAGPGLAWVVRPWLALSLQLAVVVPLRVAKFSVRQPNDGPFTVYQGSGVAGRAVLAVEWRFR